MKNIYVVDDDFDILFLLNKWFSRNGIFVKTFSSSAPLYQALQESLPDMIVLDINLHGEDGREICKQIKQIYPGQFPVILFSGNENLLKKFKDSLADGVLRKPFSLSEITQLLNTHSDAESLQK